MRVQPPMKRPITILAIAAAQAVEVLLLARIVRLLWWRAHFNVVVSDAFVFGLSAVLAFAGYLCFVFKPASPIKRRIVCVLAAIFLSFIGYIASIIILSATDMFLTKRYIARMQPQLRSDPRFANIRLLGMSCDYVLFPYIPIFGSVASEEDRRALLHTLHQAHPPAHIDAIVIRIGNAPPSVAEYFRRLHEDDYAP